MLQANCLVFPKPELQPNPRHKQKYPNPHSHMHSHKHIQKHLVFIPKDRGHKHFYLYKNKFEKYDDDLLSTGTTPTPTPTSRCEGRTEDRMKGRLEKLGKLGEDKIDKFMRFKVISAIKTHKRSNINAKQSPDMHINIPTTLTSQPEPSPHPQKHIPCLFIKGTYNQSKLIIYFHSNAEDIISAYPFVKCIADSSGRSVLMMEYVGYSVYRRGEERGGCVGGGDWSGGVDGVETTAEGIEDDAKRVLEYMQKQIGYDLKDITVMGRSIGSGPAVYIASIYPVGSLILLSPFLSLCEAVRDLYGGLCSILLKQRFNNKQRIKYVQSPTLIIHGLQDNIIPHKHSVQLTKNLKSFTILKLIQKMRHNSFAFYKDFVVHVKEFLRGLDQQIGRQSSMGMSLGVDTGIGLWDRKIGGLLGLGIGVGGDQDGDGDQFEGICVTHENEDLGELRQENSGELKRIYGVVQNKIQDLKQNSQSLKQIQLQTTQKQQNKQRHRRNLIIIS